MKIFAKKDLLYKIDEYIKELREEQPIIYNQFLLLDNLTSEEIDIMISITNRTDGKTYAHIKTLLKLNAKFGITFVLLCRHFTLRKAYLSTLFDIINNEKTHDSNNLTMYNCDEYVQVVGKKGETVCCVTDLNSASDLKYRANDMRHYDLIVYDEFIALEHEYMSYEIEALKVIYETMDRESNKRILKNPKLLCLGNAMNFSSPIISYYGLFNDIENQEMDTINIVSRLTQNNDYLKIAIELRCNKAVNERKNSKMFNLGGNNYALSGQFTTNNYLIYPNEIPDYEFIVIKYNDKYLKCYYNSLRIIINVLDYCEKYDYCNKLSDIKEDVNFLNKNYFDENHIYKMFDKSILYANTFTLQYISNNPDLQQILYEEIVEEIMYDAKQIEKMNINKNRKNRELQFLARFEGKI